MTKLLHGLGRNFLPSSVKLSLVRFYDRVSIQVMLWRYALDYYLLRKTPVIVFQMGKVGSTSVYEGLVQQGVLTTQAHSLDLPRLEQQIREGIIRFWDRKDRWAVGQWWFAKHVVPGKRPYKIITLVRDPLQMNVSGYFENLRRFTGLKNVLSQMSIMDLQRDFIDNHSQSEYPYTWFDAKMKAVLGVDVFAHPFPAEQGYTTIHEGQIDLLILRTDLPDEQKVSLIRDFLGLAEYSLPAANRGDQKAYAEAYRAFKETLVLPSEVIERAITSRLVQHFFTSDEIVEMHETWQHQELPEPLSVPTASE